MKHFLLYLSSILMFCFSATGAETRDIQPDGLRLQRYTFRIETGKASVSGLLIANENIDRIDGSMINEFGVSAIDFSYSKRKRKVKLLSVVSFLNKWYVKMVLKNDIKFCLHMLYDVPYDKEHRYEVARSEETVSIINKKYKIKYSFTPLNPL